MAEWAAPNITACPTPSTAALQQLSKVEFNTSLPENVLSTSITVASLTNNTEELTTDAVDFASTAIFNLVAAVSKDEVLNQTVGKEIVQSTLKTLDNILSVNSDAKVVMSAPAKRPAKSMERLVSTVTVEVNEPFQEQQENIAFAVSCPVNSFSTQAFRSKSPGGFFLGETNASATMTRFGVAFDISGYTIQTATERLSLSNDSLCNIAPTRFILYKTQTLFQDGNLSANTSVATEIISAQAGDSQLSDLQRPVVMSFDILTESSVDEKVNVTCVYWNFDQNNGNGGWDERGCTRVYGGVSANRTVCS
ncbi:adhesion G-protein coupled receptor G2-like [Sycon ciliatum]|uniref:adhesion G-protein coupled receptor G2-like n=1 Tax=Sycon ciliatum TaxID=27933 RepID=UPI0031F6FFFE